MTRCTLSLFILGGVLLSKACAAEAQTFIAVRPESPVGGMDTGGFRVRVAGTEVAAIHLDGPARPRQLVVVVDPDPGHRSEVRQRTLELASALAGSATDVPVRLVFPLGAGFVTPPVTDRTNLQAEVERAFDRYLPETTGEAPETTLVLDLAAALIGGMDAQAGPLDALLVFRDGDYEPPGADYLAEGSTRLFGSVLTRHGSSIHCYTGRPGVLGRACDRLGGRRFDWTAGPGEVASALVEEIKNVAVLRVDVDGIVGGAAMEVEVLSDSGRRLRAARTLWRHPESKPVPNHYSMREGLAWLRRALEAESAGNMTNTLLNAEAALRHDPWNGAACAAAGRSLRETGEWGKSVENFERAVKLGAGDEATIEAFSAVSRRAGLAARGLRSLEPLFASGLAAGGVAGRERARLQAAAGRMEAAAETYARLVAGPAASATELAEYGDVLRILGRGDEAEIQIRRALSLDPQNLRALCFLAEKAASTGDDNPARELGRRAAEIDPAGGVVQTMLGRLAEAQGDWSTAVSHYDDAIKKEGPGGELVRLLTRAMVQAGRSDEAVRFLRRRVEQDSEDPAGWRRLSDLLVQTGSVSEAAGVLESGAPGLDGDGSQLYMEAAGLRERLGQSGQALLNYRSMLRTAPPAAAGAIPSSVHTHMAALDLLSVGTDSAGAKIPASESSTGPGERAAASGGEESRLEESLEIPGGIDSFARAVGIDAAMLRQPDGLERCLFFILGSPQQRAGKGRQSGVAADAVEYLRNYADLLKFIQKQKLMPAGFDGSGEQALTFPLVGPPDTLKRTSKFLRFFGIKLSLRRNRDRSITVEVVLGQSSRSMSRQQFLRVLGVNLTDPRLQEYRVTIGSSRVPILAGAKAWSDHLLVGSRKPKSPYLLERLVSDSRAMRLYIALARSSAAARDGLIAGAPPGRLLHLSDALYRHGYALDFRDRKLQWPGEPTAWLGLLGVPPTADAATVLPALLERDGGRAAAFYAAMASAPQAVQDFLAVPGRLERVYEAAGATRPTSVISGSQIAPFSIGRTLRGLGGDSRGLLVRASDSLREHYQWRSASPGTAGANAGLIGESELSELLRVDHGNGAIPKLAFLEIFSYLSVVLPEALTPPTLDALVRDPARTPAMLDLVLDLAPTAELLQSYLEFCGSLVSEPAPKWNVNRVRSAQSVVNLLSLLRRQGVFGHADGLRLLSAALEAMKSREELEFARSLTAFLSGQLLPAIRGSTPCPSGEDVVLCALAGNARPLAVNFEGRSFQLDVSAWKLQRMKAAIQQQDCSPLASVLGAYEKLAPAGPKQGNDAVEAVRAALSLLRKPSLPPQGEKSGAADGGPSALAALAQKAASGGGGSAALLGEAAVALHAELGVSLLGYTYAFHGAPEVDVLAFDPRFVRKHDFNVRERIWLPAARTNAGPAGLRCAGSLSGLGVELGGLETAQLNQDFGSREGRDLIPSMLSGMRAVTPSLRSDRAQEFVALSVRLGREILAAASFDEPTYRWTRAYLEERVPPRRRLEVLRLLTEHRPVPAAAMLSPSELFVLADRYRVALEPTAFRAPGSVAAGSGRGSGTKGAGTEVPRLLSSSPHVERLRRLAPPGNGSEARAFRLELDQYGVLLRSRLGLSRLSLQISDPFEALEAEFPDRLLFDRICDLKIRLAELNYALGLPAALGEVEGELALREILPRGNVVRVDSWRLVLDRISQLGTQHVRDWIDELQNRGALTAVAREEPAEGGMVP